MALTEAQKSSVRLFLGWPARFYQNSPLEQAMDALGVATYAQDEAKLLAVLPKIEAIDAKITATLGHCLAMEQTDAVKFKADNGLGLLRREGRRLVKQLAAILDTPVASDYFGTGGPPNMGNYALQG